ncbi:MAG: hypothetical protein ACI8S6_005763 [Myxococcota bacterium]|jgi:hypothetical protein
MLWSRRRLGTLSAGLLLPRRLLAQETSQRRFLFIFCNGGWDQTTVFAPLFGSSYVDMDAGGEEVEAGGITFVDAEDRPSVRGFFERWGEQSCLLNGLEVPAISHDQCIRLIQAGRRTDSGDDWAAIMAGSVDSVELRLPYMVVSGPAYSSVHSSAVVRIGRDRQLAKLLDGSAFDSSDLPISTLSSTADEAVAAFLRERAAELVGAAPTGQQARFASAYARSLENLAAVRGGLGELALSEARFDTLSSSLEVALRGMELGQTRCALIEDNGLWSQGWDTHQENEHQALNFDLLFLQLDELMETLASRTGPDGAPLSETTTVVVFSEMGRQPKLNSHGGKHHWTSTSALFLGAGIAGGQVVGGFDEYSLSRPVDFATGAPTEHGMLADVDDFGATLLALADIDPGPHTYGEPIEAILR